MRLGTWCPGEFSEMSVTAEAKQQIVSDFKTHDKDTGSPEVQIALLTRRITELTEHLKTHKKTTPRVAGCSRWSAVAIIF